MYETFLAELFVKSKIKELVERNKDSITIIGIDGPTAVGKTIFANHIVDILSDSGFDVWCYGLDWTLRDRRDRVHDLENLKNKNVEFCLEAELHMDMTRVQDFLQKVSDYKYNAEDGEVREISLENLYSRENGGTCTGSSSCTLKKGKVILLEGHYTLREKIDEHIDLNILLLAESEELINRKIDRVKNYRSPDEAIDYYWRVDLPSIRFHLERYWHNADFIVDNTDCKKPRVMDKSFISKWLTRNKTKYNQSNLQLNELSSKNIFDFIFSSSIMLTNDLSSVINDAFAMVMDIDKTIGNYFRLAIQDIEEDLSFKLLNVVNLFNKKNKNASIVIEYTNSFQNVYFRRLPVAVGLSVKCNEYNFKILGESRNKNLNVIFSWEGGIHNFSIQREIGSIDNYDVDNKIKIIKNKDLTDNEYKVWIPTDYFIPSFFKDKSYKSDIIFSGFEDKSITASEIILQVFHSKKFLWIHRFPKHASVRFFMQLIEQLGAQSVKVGSYLIVFKSKDGKSIDDFSLFRNKWKLEPYDHSGTILDEIKYDDIIENDRNYISTYVKRNCKSLYVLDSYLFSNIRIYDEKWNDVVSEILKMLHSNHRLLRKRAIEFIKQVHPGMQLRTEKIWDLGTEVKQRLITLDELDSVYPSILSEAILWSSIREERSACLCINTYDMRNGESLDALAHIITSSEQNIPIVLQSSLEKINLESNNEYNSANINKLTRDYVKVISNMAKKAFLLNCELPLYGIGINLADNESLSGKVKNIMGCESFYDELITYQVSENSDIINEDKSIINCSTPDSSNKRRSYIYDKKVVYKQNFKSLNNLNNVEVFIKKFRNHFRISEAGENNTRPKFISIGFKENQNEVNSMIDLSRINNDIHKYNYIVTDSINQLRFEPISGESMQDGSYNTSAIDDLTVVSSSMPKNFKNRINENQSDSLSLVKCIREEISNLIDEQREEFVKKITTFDSVVFSNSKSTSLKKHDLNYFKYKFHKYSDLEKKEIEYSLLQLAEEKKVIEERKALLPNIGWQFSSSMIEVPYDDKYEDVVDQIISNDINYFHIDVGDGEFISREFSGLRKASYISNLKKDIHLHAHLMVKDPHVIRDSRHSIIQQYIEAGCEAVAIHLRAFSSIEGFDDAVTQIKEMDKRVGLIIELDTSIDSSLFSLLLKYEIDWVVVMGVVVGYGGQVFNTDTLSRIAQLNDWASRNKYPLLIEVDGGMTIENIRLCKKHGAQVFAGWSVVKSDTSEKMIEKIKCINEVLNEKN